MTKKEKNESKPINTWEKWKIISTSISVLLVPILLAFIANIYSKSIKESELKVKYLDLAIKILQQEPKKENESIRSWALEIINHYSEIKINKSTGAMLIKESTLIPYKKCTTDGLYSHMASDGDSVLSIVNYCGFSIKDINSYKLPTLESGDVIHFSLNGNNVNKITIYKDNRFEVIDFTKNEYKNSLPSGEEKTLLIEGFIETTFYDSLKSNAYLPKDDGFYKKIISELEKHEGKTIDLGNLKKGLKYNLSIQYIYNKATKHSEVLGASLFISE